MVRAGEGLPGAGGEQYRPEEWRQVAKAKKPSREFVKHAVRRLMGKPFAPTDAVAVGVLIDAIAKACGTEGHVTRLVEQLLVTIPRWPDVTDVLALAPGLRDVESRPDPSCAKCGGVGHTSEDRLENGPCGPALYAYSRRCSCWSLVRVAS